MKAEHLNNHFVLDPRSGSDLRLKLRQDPQAGAKQAAQQFEGLLLQMMLKSMRSTTSPNGLLDSDQTRFFTSILDQQLAQNLSSQGRLGLARMIEQQLGKNAPSEGNKAIPSPFNLMQQVLMQSGAASPAAAFAADAPRSTIPPRLVAAAEPVPDIPAGGNDFVNRVWPHAVQAARRLGVPPHFLVAHSALESGWGKHEIRAQDGSITHNIFGIKAGRSWRGPSVEVPTIEYVDGVARTTKEKFRVYGSYGEAFQDYANLLCGNPRFSEVLGQRDGIGFARSLQQSGYATDPLYADKLGRIIGGATLRQALAG